MPSASTFPIMGPLPLPVELEALGAAASAEAARDPPPPLALEWNLPCLTLAAYAAFVPLTVFCALHWTLGALMWVTGLITALLESAMVVEKPATDLRRASAGSVRLIGRDMLQGLRVLSTTVLPILLASFQGGSFVVSATLLRPRVANCSVADLPRLAEAGYTSFGCTDGYVAVDLQLGVPAWGAVPGDEERSNIVREHRLEAQDAHAPDQWLVTEAGRIPVVGRSEGGRLGFAAPIFRSLKAREDGEAPVAWAVKAGSPVKRSVCDDNLGLPGTCGFFSATLKRDWRRFLLAPAWFGQSWGFNITRFSEGEMLEAVAEVRRRHPSANPDGPSPPTFVVAEDVRQYFGAAYPSLWVLATLLCVGLIDRIIGALELLPAAQDHSTPQYSKMVFQDEALVAGPDVAPGFLEDILGFWNDPLNTRRIHEVTGAIDTATAPPSSRSGLPSSRSRVTSAPPMSARSRHGLLTPGR